MGWQDDPLVDEPWEADELVNPPTKPQPKPLNRMGALGGGLATGLSGLAGIPSDFVRNVANLGLTGFGAIKNAVTGRSDSPRVIGGLPGGSEAIMGKLNASGIGTDNPNPDDPASRMLHTAGTIVGGSLFPGSGIRSTLGAAAGGAVAGEVAPGNPLATAAGAIAGGVGAAGRPRAVPTKRADNLAAFKAAGVKPTAGLVTENNFVNGIENLVAKFPGGTGIMTRVREDMQKALGKPTKTGVSAEEAGRAIEQGITGKGGFLKTTSARYKQLDAAMAAKVPKGTTVIPFETTKVLDELTAPTPGAEFTTGDMANPVLVRMKNNLEADKAANNGRISFEGLRKIRTDVRTMQENSIVSGVAGGQAKRLYGALSDDLEAAAAQAGAGREFARQNQYWKARMGRVEQVLERVIGKDRPAEEIFRTFYPKDPTQVTKVRATMRSLPLDERKIVTQAVVDRLGRATPGKQDEFGEVFSSETFLTNWMKLSKGAKAQLFPDKNMAGQLDAIATVASKVRSGASAMSNPSGTAGSFAGYSVYMAPLIGLGTMSLAPVAGAAGAVTAANLTARLLTNQKFVGWLARAPKDPKGVAAHLARLTVIYNTTDDEALKSDLEQYIQSMNGEQ